MSDQKYILDGIEIKPADLMTWARWFETADRRIARDQIGACDVSTVFIGINLSFGSDPPLLFETMVFFDGSGTEAWMDRCSTYSEAIAMHERGCQFARESQAAASEAIDRAKPEPSP